MYFCYPLRNDFAEVDLVYQQALPSNTLLDLSVPFQQIKKRKKNQSLIICCIRFCHLQSHKKDTEERNKNWGSSYSFLKANLTVTFPTRHENFCPNAQKHRLDWTSCPGHSNTETDLEREC